MTRWPFHIGCKESLPLRADTDIRTSGLIQAHASLVPCHEGMMVASKACEWRAQERPVWLKFKTGTCEYGHAGSQQRIMPPAVACILEAHSTDGHAARSKREEETSKPERPETLQ